MRIRRYAHLLLVIALAGCGRAGGGATSAPIPAPSQIAADLQHATVAPASTSTPAPTPAPSAIPTSAPTASPLPTPTFSPTPSPAPQAASTPAAEQGVRRAPLDANTNGAVISQPAISPLFEQDQTLLGIGSDERLYRSTDGGEQWSTQPFSATALLLFSPDYANDRAIFAVWPEPYPATSAHVLRSTDAGATWQELASVDIHPMFATLKLYASPTFAQDRTLFLIAKGQYIDSDFGFLYRSTDGGGTWQGMSQPCSAGALAISPGYAQDRKLYLVCFAISPHTTSGGLGLHRSADAGKTWEVLGYGAISEIALLPTTPEPQVVVPLLLNPRPASEVRTWEQLAQVIRTLLSVQAVATGSGAHVFAIAAVGDENQNTFSLLRSTNAGLNWSVVAEDMGTRESGAASFSAAVAADGRAFVFVSVAGQLWLLETSAAGGE